MNGRVVKTENGIAKVRVVRDTACGDSCASCNLCSNRERIIVAKNPIDAKVGDFVVVSEASAKILFYAFCVYIIPMILITFGYMMYEILGIIAAIVVSITMMKFLDNKKRKDYNSSIIRILEV